MQKSNVLLKKIELEMVMGLRECGGSFCRSCKSELYEYKLPHMSSEDFRRYLRIFATTHDVNEHHEAISLLLEPLDLDVEYSSFCKDGGLDKVLDVFEGFAEIPEDEYVGGYERSSLTHVGNMTREYFAKREFLSFAQMVFLMVLESLLEHYEMLEGVEVTAKQIDTLYSQLDHDIYVQTFILEHMAHKDHFAWERDEKILEQSLIALTVCFSDIFAYLGESDEEESVLG